MLRNELKANVAGSRYFETNYDYIRSQAFENENFDPDLRINAKLWLRELF
jgi:hypothetical protein